MVAPTCPSSLQTELVLMLTRIAQLPALSLTTAALLFIPPAGSSSLQTELVLMLTCPAQARTILRIGRSWKYHEKQARHRGGNKRQFFITHVTYLSFFSHQDTIVRTGLSVNWVILPTRRRTATRVPQMAREGDAEARHPSLRQGKQAPLFLIIRKMNPPSRRWTR
jgi:hypothetical protein